MRFRLGPEFKIPHIGWNGVSFLQEETLNREIHSTMDQFYFVHSYYVIPEDPNIVWCQTDYGRQFTSGICLGNCFATQFHPEKSQAKGLHLYRNFLKSL